MFNWRQKLANLKEDYFDGRHWLWRILLAGLGVYLIIALVLGLLWNGEPDLPEQPQKGIVTGAATTQTLINLGNTLLQKPGGFLSNDVSLPGVWMDNIPNWEYGVLI